MSPSPLLEQALETLESPNELAVRAEARAKAAAVQRAEVPQCYLSVPLPLPLPLPLSLPLRVSKLVHVPECGIGQDERFPGKGGGWEFPSAEDAKESQLTESVVAAKKQVADKIYEPKIR